MKFRFVVAGIVGLSAVVLNSCTNSNSTTTSTGTGFMWIATQGDQMVSSYNINLNSGAVSQVGSAVATGVTPIAMAITPAGDALFIANSGDNTISAYGLNSDGSLKVPCASSQPECTIVTVPAGQNPIALAVDPSGKLLFTANNGSGTISVFSIQAGGLTFLQSFPTDPTSLTGTGPASVIVSPTSLSCKVAITNQTETCYFLYAANQFTSTISAFAYFVDSSGNFVTGSLDNSGTITPGGTLANSPYTVGTNPSGLAFSRCTGTTSATTACPTTAPPSYLFVANTGSNDISILSACVQITTSCPTADGSLVPVASPTVAAGTHPISFVVNPARDFVYAVDNGSFQVSEYRYSSATGALTFLSTSAISTGASPLAGGITSDGNWVFVPNNGGSTVSAYGVGSAGQLTVGTAITLLGQPSAVLVR